MRAANFRELYYGQFIHAGGSFGYCGPASTFQADPCDWSLEGNVNLKPEQADTTTFGIVFTPSEYAKGLQFAVDAFDIKRDPAGEHPARARRLSDQPAAGVLRLDRSRRAGPIPIQSGDELGRREHPRARVQRQRVHVRRHRHHGELPCRFQRLVAELPSARDAHDGAAVPADARPAVRERRRPDRHEQLVPLGLSADGRLGCELRDDLLAQSRERHGPGAVRPAS